jgi:uncharacterized membrane protein
LLRWLVAYVAAGLAVGALDAVWLTTTNATLYRPTLGPIMADSVRPVPAVLFYALYLAGIVLFAVAPAVRSGRWTTAILLGAAFGFIAYGTYDLTNQATLKLWATKITVLDMGWGAFLTAVGASAGFWAVKLTGMARPV